MQGATDSDARLLTFRKLQGDAPFLGPIAQMGLLLKGEPEVVAAAEKATSGLVNLNLQGFPGNLVPVTIGNIFGGGFMVALFYWFIYRRPQGKRFRVRQVVELLLGAPAAPYPTELE